MDKIKDKLIKYSKVKIVQTLTKILKTGMYQRMARRNGSICRFLTEFPGENHSPVSSVLAVIWRNDDLSVENRVGRVDRSNFVTSRWSNHRGQKIQGKYWLV